VVTNPVPTKQKSFHFSVSCGSWDDYTFRRLHSTAMIIIQLYEILSAQKMGNSSHTQDIENGYSTTFLTLGFHMASGVLIDGYRIVQTVRAFYSPLLLRSDGFPRTANLLLHFMGWLLDSDILHAHTSKGSTYSE
jgi:hypothetical protein